MIPPDECKDPSFCGFAQTGEGTETGYRRDVVGAVPYICSNLRQNVVGGGALDAPAEYGYLPLTVLGEYVTPMVPGYRSAIRYYLPKCATGGFLRRAYLARGSATLAPP